MDLLDGLLTASIHTWCRLALVGPDRHEELGDLVRILTRRRHFDRTCPVVVKVAQGVGQLFDVEAAQVGVVPGTIEVRWQHAALIGRARRQVEVELLGIYMRVH